MSSFPSFTDVATACAHHANRPPVALCRTCLKPSCGECVTKLDGVNHCSECLLAAHPPRVRPPRTPIARNPFRIAFATWAYSLVAIAAAAFGAAMPFFALEQRASLNRDRLTELHLKLSAYQNDVGAYPADLGDLLANDGTGGWAGPYTTARAADGNPPADPKDEGKVLDVFGRPVAYYQSPVTEEDTLPDRVYIASAGANGSWDTPGIASGNPPRDPLGDDALEWVAW